MQEEEQAAEEEDARDDGNREDGLPVVLIPPGGDRRVWVRRWSESVPVRERGGGSTVVSLYPIACNILFESNMFALVALVLDPLAGPSMPSEA